MNADELYEIADELRDAIKDAESVVMGAANKLRPIRVFLDRRGIDASDVDSAAFDAEIEAGDIADAGQRVVDAAKEAQEALQDVH